MKQHKVREGECLTSIAASYGFSWETLWDLSDNAALKEKRKDPNMLVPGDVVAVPDLREKVVSCETTKLHRFRLAATPAMFRVQLFEDEKPLANQDFELKIGQLVHTGQTDDQGVLEVALPATAREGTLIVGPEKKTFDLRFGHLQPVSEKEGIEARLRNLGFESLGLFQRRFGLEETGEADQATRDKLAAVHDEICGFPE
jgi:hypothetical protein